MSGSSKLYSGGVGGLRHSVTIQKPIRIANGSGGFNEEWADVATVYAAIRPWSGMERIFGGQIREDVTHFITIRGGLDIKSNMRIVFGNSIFQIHGVMNREYRGIWYDLLCQEGPAT